MNKKLRILLLAMTMMASAVIGVKAKDADEAAKELYGQIVTNEQAAAITYIGKDVDTADVIAKIVEIDDKENTYDGAMAIYKAPSFKVVLYGNGKMELTLNNAFSVKESEQVLDIMSAEINKSLDKDSTQQDKLKAIINFIANNFKYDNSDDVTEYQNFVQAYKGNKEIVCNQYAILTLLLCDRYGIDCKLIEGNDHVFSLIRLEGEEKYTAYDLTKTSNHLSAKVGYLDQLTGTYAHINNANKYQQALARVINTASYKISVTLEDTILALSVIMMSVAAYSIVKRKTRRTKARIIVSKR